ncbi:MAG: Rieske (2Fe-2S) protein [Kiloniellaceae bacterium]
MSAPRALCRLEDIADGQAKGFILDDGREIFVVRAGGEVHGYVNSCPHQGTPLDWTPDCFISAQTGLIMCATHGAQFRIEDGACVAGPCAGNKLRPAPVRLDGDGRVVLDAERSRAAP